MMAILDVTCPYIDRSIWELRDARPSILPIKAAVSADADEALRGPSFPITNPLRRREEVRCGMSCYS